MLAFSIESRVIDVNPAAARWKTFWKKIASRRVAIAHRDPGDVKTGH